MGQEERGREVYGRREKRGQEAGFPRWQELREKWKNYAIFCNKKHTKRWEPPNTGQEPGLKGT